MQASTIMSLIK